MCTKYSTVVCHTNICSAIVSTYNTINSSDFDVLNVQSTCLLFFFFIFVQVCKILLRNFFSKDDICTNVLYMIWPTQVLAFGCALYIILITKRKGYRSDVCNILRTKVILFCLFLFEKRVKRDKLAIKWVIHKVNIFVFINLNKEKALCYPREGMINSKLKYSF